MKLFLQVMVRHRRLNPLCPFVLSPLSTDNVFMTPDATQPVQLMSVPRTGRVIPAVAQYIEMGVEADEVDLPQAAVPAEQPVNPPPSMLNEKARLETFKNWPVPFISPLMLARAGFFYFNDSDRVKCAYCDGVIEKWEPGDNPFEEHHRFFPTCSRVQLTTNAENNSDSSSSGGSSGLIQDAVASQNLMRGPKKPKFSSIEARLRTFAKWPRSDIQKPLILAISGFYYQEIDDQVRCFHCSGGLRAWQKEDDPWFEHAKWFPRCVFVNHVKGPEYVQSVQNQIINPPSANRNDQSQSSTAVDLLLDEAMQSEPVATALLMGLHEGRVRAATQRHIEETGGPYIQSEPLIAAVLEGQHEEQDDTDEAEPSSNIVREVSRILNTIFNTTSSTTMTPVLDEDPSQPAEASGYTPPEPMDLQSARMVAPAARVAEPKSTAQSLAEENRQLKDARLCKICMDNEVAAVYLPCGHIGEFLFNLPSLML